MLFLPVCHLHDDLDAFISERDFSTQSNIADGPEENRIWRVLVSEKLDTCLYGVKDEKDFQKCFREIFEAHYRVYEKARILHRDISILNIMVRKGSDGTMIGVLNDWDLAEDPSEASELSGPHAGTTTGTRPFVSKEFHDVELPPDQQAEAEKEAKERAVAGKWELWNNRAMLRKWWTKTDHELYVDKGYTLGYQGKEDFLQSPYRFSTTVETWISPIWDLFIDGYSAKTMAKRRMQAFDEETLGNHVTYQKIHDILKNIP